MSSLLIQTEQIVKTYRTGGLRLRILNRVDFAVRRGEFIAIMGPSGSGKSTLLNILGCMDRPDSGKYCFSGRNLSQAHEKYRSQLRSSCIGFVFQNFNLVHSLNVLENVELPFLYAPPGKRKNRRHAIEAISRVGLAHRMHHRPGQLSGGEMQRAAIARALAVDPELILADEPTGNLDEKTGEAVLQLLGSLRELGKTIVIVTHDRQVAGYAEKQMTLQNGILF